VNARMNAPMNDPGSGRLAPAEADRLRRAERRWLEQARERLHRPGRRTGPAPDAHRPPQDALPPQALPLEALPPEETDR
jgi:hypothetical protein